MKKNAEKSNKMIVCFLKAMVQDVADRLDRVF